VGLPVLFASLLEVGFAVGCSVDFLLGFRVGCMVGFFLGLLLHGDLSA